MSDTVAARQAALLLHGLAPQARRAVLAKLAIVDVNRLKPLLSELEEMGIPSALGRQLNVPVAVMNGSSPEEKVGMLTAEEMAAALKGSAPITIAQLTRSRDWSWRPHILASLPEPIRGAVADALRRDIPELPPAVVRRLCQRLCERWTF